MAVSNKNAGHLGRRAVLGSAAALPLVNVSRAYARGPLPAVGFISLFGKEDAAGKGMIKRDTNAG